MALLGVMQGRLLPKYQNRYQAHPVDYWEKEFPVAAELGLDLVEWILDYSGFKHNPIMTREGIARIQKLSEQYGIAVKSICADLFMDFPFHGVAQSLASDSLAILKQLIFQCRIVGIDTIVIPCVDHSSILNDPVRFQELINGLIEVSDFAEKADVNLALETDLPPQDFLSLLEQLPSPKVTVNYDTGNSASLGYNPVEEFAAYGKRITDIHIKDRVRNGGSVILGHGDVDFPQIFSCCSQLKYDGIFVMQAYRDDEGVSIFQKQLEWIAPFFKSEKVAMRR